VAHVAWKKLLDFGGNTDHVGVRVKVGSEVTVRWSWTIVYSIRFVGGARSYLTTPGLFLSDVSLTVTILWDQWPWQRYVLYRVPF